MLSIWAIHFWSTTLKRTTLSISLNCSSPNSSSLPLYIFITVSVSLSFICSLDKSANSCTVTIPCGKQISSKYWSNVLISASISWTSPLKCELTASDITSWIIPSICSFKFLPSKTSVLCL